jgi:hypothetical protein
MLLQQPWDLAAAMGHHAAVYAAAGCLTVLQLYPGGAVSTCMLPKCT